MRIIAISLIILVTCAISALSAHAAPREFDEYEVKAVFLGNFLKFVDWPKNERDIRNYSICIYGSDPFGPHTRLIGDMKVRGKAVKVRNVRALRALNECSVLFVSSSEGRRVNSILEEVSGLDILTVGDTEGYAEQGIMVNFYIEAKKVKFEINLTSIKRSRINVSSQLLKLGRMVDHE